MDIASWFDINNTFVNIPVGDGYAMSWIEMIGTVFGLLCIWCASKEKNINYFFGLVNVTLFAIIFYQIQLYGLLVLQLFFFCANIYGWYAWTRPDAMDGQALKIRWLPKEKLIKISFISLVAIFLLTLFIDQFFNVLAQVSVAIINVFGGSVTLGSLEPDAFPFWDATMTVLSIVAQILMTRKYVENWILWVVINMISVGVYAAQGVYAMSIEYLILLFIALNGTKDWMQTAKRNNKESAYPKSEAIV